MLTTVKKRSVVVAGHRTSVSLEAAFWDALRAIAQREHKTLNQLVSDIDQSRSGNLSSAIRVYVLHKVRGPADEAEAPEERPAAQSSGH
ncbi:MAG TPA: ribbon-helix-helix domain-containing protein [Candidatus Cybelea sp.]|nr:ribbon-helix-helix domain-containing protein [Candidatus Cybelea sp.]